MQVFPNLPAQRVQVPAYTDRWMMGDRYGDLVAVTRRGEREIARVKLDKSGKVCRFVFADCTVV